MVLGDLEQVIDCMIVKQKVSSGYILSRGEGKHQLCKDFFIAQK